MLDKARALLKATFGYSEFRGSQDAIIAELLAGGDALVLMPTGGGKSLCYQLPALLREGVGVVVSPLIALMKDQVDTLLQLGVRAAYLNSSLSAQQAYDVEQQLLRGDLDLLYVAPERLMTEHFLELLKRLKLALFAIDEAHCVSQWGHDFRPEYLQLSILAELFPEVPRIALTATADEMTRREILEKLQLAQAQQFISSFDRPNIRYRVVDKQNAREQFLAFYQTEQQGNAGIVYCLSRKSVDETALWLKKRGVSALPYHAGLASQLRQKHQERFLREDGLVMVATIAFGMGIDKPDVRFVAHLDLPKSLEGYYQETGRAGRDGLPADAFMTYGLADVVTMRRMLESSGADEMFKRVEQQRLEKLLGFCESPRCRRQLLLEYFGEQLAEPCGNCDTCLTEVETWDGTVQAQKALSTVVRSGQRFGAGHVIDILLGKTTPRMQTLGHERLSTYGIGQELNEKQWRSVFRQLVAAAYLTTDAQGFGALRLAKTSAAVLKGQLSVYFRRDPLPQKTKTRKTALALSPSVNALFEHLRALRAQLAKEQNVPAYVIFHDATLKQMAELKPRTLQRMGTIHGIGHSKLERYGDAFLKLILEHYAGAAEPQPVSEVSEADTYARTLELFLAAKSIVEIAQERDLTPRTIENHLVELVARGDLTLEEATALSEPDIRLIQEAIAALAQEEQRYLKPLYEKLEARYDYWILKCVHISLQPET